MVTVTRPRARVLGVALAVGGFVLAGCSPAPDGPPPRDATCPWTAPPRDPTRPASVCRVAGTDLTAGIPRHADLLPVTIELYDDHERSCVAATGCVIGDNRDFQRAPSPDPGADPSRRRALLTLDFGDDRADLHLAPRCHIVGPPDQPGQRCLSVAPEVTRFTLTGAPGASRPWRFQLVLELPADPGGTPTPATTEHWDLVLDPITKVLTLTGEGTGTPDFALVAGNMVRCAVPETAPPTSSAPPATTRYACSITLTASP